VVLHARRTPDRGTIGVRNSHPFIETWAGTTWAFCHNGAVSDISQLRPEPSLHSEGAIDSEVIFHHVLGQMDPEEPEVSLTASLSGIRDFTCLNCFLVTPEGVTYYARAADDSPRPRYYALWRGRADGLSIVSSEPFPALDLVWKPVPAGRALRLTA
jgi:predicted glutamine amidotransferase